MWNMTSQSKKMKVQCLNLDRISSLPQNITGQILTCMPIRDAIRTSILSRKWRSGWKSMTKLVFDDKMIKVPFERQQIKKYKLASAILNVLLKHTGLILEVKIEVGELDVDSEFDQIICYLSRITRFETLCFDGSLKHYYKLPSSFFSLRGLVATELSNCVFRPPIIFDGFSKLYFVRFENVDITSTTLQRFLSNCPLVSVLTLMVLETLLADTAQLSKNFPGMQDYSGFTLEHLDIFQMVSFANEDLMEFVKLIMAKSPRLKKAEIVLYEHASLEEEIKMLRKLIQLQFPRASPSAKLIVKRRELPT